jgi:hypothetical protein
MTAFSQTKWITSRELILPKDVGINHFCNNRFKANYYIGNNYWANVKILIKVENSKIKYPLKYDKIILKKKSYLKIKF